MSDTLTVEQRGPVRIVTMDDGKANAFSLGVINDLRGLLREAEADDETRSLVIAGREGRFSGGFDLSAMRAGDVDAVVELVAAGGALVADLYASPLTVVAAATGHAVAAGALVLLGCDHRVGVDGPVKIGLNEVAIGMVLPPWALIIARDRLSKRYFHSSTTNARLFDGRTAVDAGFLDEVVAAESVVERALEKATELSALVPAAYARTVEVVRGPVIAEMRAVDPRSIL
ncbi:MAG: crotonase/enoyl-CoA hydratase family protein [Actinobacteria bacterium]|jgi:enoyl-CoA hydratase|nr:crotonase/enoyl-CoA hydratase family protein [Actinomycetota bacterium]